MECEPLSQRFTQSIWHWVWAIISPFYSEVYDPECELLSQHFTQKCMALNVNHYLNILLKVSDREQAFVYTHCIHLPAKMCPLVLGEITRNVLTVKLITEFTHFWICKLCFVHAMIKNTILSFRLSEKWNKYYFLLSHIGSFFSAVFALQEK